MNIKRNNQSQCRLEVCDTAGWKPALQWTALMALAILAFIFHPAAVALCAPAVLTPEEFAKGLTDIKLELGKQSDAYKKEIGDLNSALKEVREGKEKLQGEVDKLRKGAFARSNQPLIRRPGRVSDDCAKYLGAMHIMASKAAGKTVNEKVVKWAQEYIDAQTAGFESEPNGAELREYAKHAREIKAALTGSDIPLPVTYSAEIIEFVEAFGTFRKYATVYPMGPGQNNIPHLTTDPAFNFLAMSAALTEKSPQIANVALDAKKAGGIIRIPTELDEDSIVALGQFLARYIARQVANWEDQTGWNADGSGTYLTLEGVKTRINTNAKLVTLTTGNTGTDDVTLANLRTLRGVPSAAVYEEDAAYYMHPTMEALLSGFNSGGTNPWNPERETLDGWPVRWVNKFSAYSTAAVVSTVVVAFGAMRYWILGERGSLRIDYSSHVYFATDETALRAVWRFCVKEVETTHMAGIKTAAS